MERRNSVAGELRHLETPSSGNAQGHGTCLSYFGRMWPRWYTSSRGRLSVIFNPTPRASKSASVLLNKLFLRSAEDLPASLSHSLASELSCANELGQSRAGSGTGMPLLAASSRARWLFFSSMVNFTLFMLFKIEKISSVDSRSRETSRSKNRSRRM